MTFIVNGIRQEKDQKFTIELALEINDEANARKLLEENNIMILSLTASSIDANTFGDVYFTIKNTFQEIRIVTKYTDIQDACNFFTFLGFDIQSINRYTKPLLDEEMEVIISNGQAYAATKKAEIWKTILEKETRERKIYEDPELVSAKKIVEKVFEKVDEAKKRASDIISVQQNKSLNLLVEELKKLRMGTNLEMIKETIVEIFAVLETINDSYFDSIQNTQARIAPDSVITETDVAREQERLEYIKMIKALHAHIALKNKDYALFGDSALYRKFLQRDFRAKASDIGGLLYHLYDLTELILVIIVSLLGIYTLANELYVFTVHQAGLAFSLISMGIRGAVIFAARYFRKRAVGKLLLIMMLAILMHYLLMWVVTTNFAL